MVTNDLQGFQRETRTKAVARNVSELVSLLEDDVFAVRRAAARALGAVGDPRTVSALAAVLGASTRRPVLPPPGRSSASGPHQEAPLAALASSDVALREIVTSALAEYFAVFHASVPEPEATDPTALAALRATLRRPWLPPFGSGSPLSPVRFVELMLRINADTPEMLVAAMATPDPTLQKLLRSQLAWRVDKTRMDVPSWFDVTGGRRNASICRPPGG